jgi:putative Ca2+/H+ antiporter (TMEM165/GDT1 family)
MTMAFYVLLLAVLLPTTSGAAPISLSDDALASAAVGGLPTKSTSGGETVVPDAALAATKELTHDEMNQAHRAAQSDHVFTILDHDHDEFLSRDEFRTYYQHQGDYNNPHSMDMAQIVSDTTEKALGFWSGFFNSLAMIIVTELGDKTFFIAALLSMRYSPAAVFTGSWVALIIMTILSTAIGFALPQLLPRKYTGLLACGLFSFFGYKLLHEAYEMYSEGKGKSTDISDELTEAEEELQQKGLVKGSLLPLSADPEAGAGGKGEKMKSESEIAMSILWQALTLTFFAEWGDRSQIATIAMASHQDPFGVTFGGCIGHGLCTGLACVGGRFLAARISERMVLLAGGSLFVIFAIHALISFMAGQ